MMTRTLETAQAADVARPVRTITRARFNDAYRRLILANAFTEESVYYDRYIDRYRRTLEYFANLPLPLPAEVIEIGGGQVALLAQELFRDRAMVGDVNRQYARSVTEHGVEFLKCDLLHDKLTSDRMCDVIILCEVIEHLPIPLYTVLQRLLPALRPGGFILLTTPNLYRLRNVVRLALGRNIFCPFFYPDESTSLGHVLEFSKSHLEWQLRRSGLVDIRIELVQLSNRGASVKADILRALVSPLYHLRPLWRDGLVAWARKASNSGAIQR